MHWETLVRRSIPFDALEREQASCIESVQNNPDLGFLLVSEPSPTFTHGRSASPEDLIWSEQERRERNVGIYEVSRGGQWTFHGPGQIVLYPIVQLTSLGLGPRDIRTFLETLRQSLVRGLAELQIEVVPGDAPFGLYANDAKVASFGMAFHRGISAHGVAVYYGPQTHFFGGIHPCGQPQGKVTSLTELGLKRSWEDTAACLVNSFKNSFKSL